MTHYQHKLKCMRCGLHFIVCSDHKDWPDHGTTREQKTGESTGLVHCPECGYSGKWRAVEFVHWVEEVEGPIYQVVPGNALLLM